MVSTAPRYEAQDKAQNNLKYRLFRYFEREWGVPVSIPTPIPGPPPPPGSEDDAELGAIAIGEG